MRSFVIFAAALSFAASLQAEPMQTVTASINIGDLDLASPEGQRTLRHRVADALEQVCGSYANAREQYEQMRIDQCRAAAMSDARNQIANRSTRLHLAARDPR